MDRLHSFFVFNHEIPSNAIFGEYQFSLVFISYVIATLAAFVAIAVLRQINLQNPSSIRWGRWVGAMVMGVGIWTMHFTGMIAFKMNMEHTYNVALTIVSLLIAILFSYTVFYNITRDTLTPVRVLLTSPLMGVGVALMHYTGMAAMEMKGTIKYLPDLFILSFIIAVIASAASMCIMYLVITINKNKDLCHFIAAMIMGLAVCGMHYTGMEASVFIPRYDCILSPNNTPIGLVTTIIIFSLFLIGVTFFLLLTARKSKDAIEHERLFTQTIIDAMPEPIFVKDINHVWVAGNQAFWTMMGGPAEKFVGKNDHSMFPPEQRAVFFEQDDVVIKTGKININEESITDSKGLTIVALTTKSPLTFSDGTLGLVGVVRDITERKKNEDELKQHRDNLQFLVEKQTKKIRKEFERNIRLQIESRMNSEKSARDKSEFLSNMSHELRTPMHAILNYANMGLKCLSLGKDKSEKLQKYLGNIQLSGNRLLGLLNNLLDLAKMESGKMSFIFVQEDLRDVIKYTQVELDSLLKEKHLSMTMDIVSQSTKAIFDKQRIIQLMVNILSNAIRYSPEKATINIILSDTNLPLGGEALCCSIANSGDNIPESELETIFDKFIQSSKTKTGAGGTGLGLAISREIIEAHGGKIWAKNDISSGVTFSFILPKKQLKKQ